MENYSPLSLSFSLQLCIGTTFTLSFCLNVFCVLFCRFVFHVRKEMEDQQTWKSKESCCSFFLWKDKQKKVTSDQSMYVQFFYSFYRNWVPKVFTTVYKYLERDVPVVVQEYWKFRESRKMEWNKKWIRQDHL